MANDRSLEKTTLKELGALAQSLGLERWSQLRKAELIEAIHDAQAKLEATKATRQDRAKAKKGRKSVKETPAQESASSDEARSSKESAPKRRERKSAKKDAVVETVAQDVTPAVEVAETTEKKSKRSRRAPSKAPTLFDVNGEDEPQEKPRRGRSKAVSQSPTLEQIVSKVVEQVTEHTEQLVAGLVAELQEKQKMIDDLTETEKKKSRGRKKRGVVESEANDGTTSASVEETPVETKVEETAESVKPEATKQSRRGRRGRKNVDEKEAVDIAAETLDKQVETPAVEVEEPTDKKAEDQVEPAPKKRRARAKKAAAEETTEANKSEENEAQEAKAEDAVEEAKPARRGRRSRKSSKTNENAASVETSSEFSGADDGPDMSELDNDEEETIDVDDLLGDLAWADEDDEIEDDELDDDEDIFLEGGEEFVDVTEMSGVPEIEEPELAESSLELREKMRTQKTIGTPNDSVDKLRLVACDAFWLRAYWQITRQLVDRTRVAMGRFWHTADPILRVYVVDNDTKYASARREHYADVEIRGGLNSWYVNVDNSPNSFVVELGYRSRDGQFFALASSNVASTPQPSARESYNRVEMEERSFTCAIPRRPRAPEIPRTPSTTSNDDAFPVSPTFGGFGAFGSLDSDEPKLDIDVEIVIKGRTSPSATVTIKEEPIRLNSEGGFSVRYSLPERRHVFPVMMTSEDGVESQTIVLAIDRNTKTLDPVLKGDEDE